MNASVLKTDRLILRKAKASDLYLIWNNVWIDESIAKNMLWKVTKTKEEALKRLERTIKYQKENYAYFICLKGTDEPIGFAGIKEKETGIYEESGICIATKYQAKGYAKEVLSALLDLVFNKLDGEKFIYGCFHTNDNSRKVCLSHGFKYLNSEEIVREYDQMKIIVDNYYLDKDMYFKNN